MTNKMMTVQEAKGADLISAESYSKFYSNLSPDHPVLVTESGRVWAFMGAIEIGPDEEE